MYFLLISSNYMNTDVTFNLLMRQKNLLWKDNKAKTLFWIDIRRMYKCINFCNFFQH